MASAKRPDGARARGGRLSRPTAAFWGGADYDAIVPHFAPIYDDLVAHLAPKPGERFLDVATGTGEIALRAAHAGADVTALDLTPELLELARAKPGADAVHFDEGDAHALPYADGSFDVVASNFGVIFAADREAGARELARVCRRGGRLGLTAWYPRPALDEVWSRFGRPPSGDFYGWADRHEQERLLGRPFELERQERVWHLEGENGEAVYEFWSRTAPASKALLDSLDDESRAEARAELVAYWEGFRRGARISEPRPYVLVLGRRR